MKEFFYRAKYEDGTDETGYLKARNHAQAGRLLLERYATVVEVAEANRKAAEKPYRIKPDIIAVFFRRLATMLGAGVPLAESLDFLAASEEGTELGEAATQLYRGVVAGKSLSATMREPRFERIFNPVMVGMMGLAEQTGSLTRVMEKLADLTERQVKLTRSFVSALTYPAVLTVVIFGMGILFTTILGPGDEGLFAAFGEDLPWPTVVVTKISDFVRNPYYVIGLLVLILGTIYLTNDFLKRNEHARLHVHYWSLRMPIVGELLKKTECARILYVMAGGLQVGMPITRVMSLACGVCKNDKLRRDFIDVIKLFTSGEELSEALARFELFPTMVVSMVDVGTESGNLDTIMGDVSQSYEEDVQMALDNVSRLAEPVLLMFAGLMAAFLALATLMPIIKMVENF